MSNVKVMPMRTVYMYLFISSCTTSFSEADLELDFVGGHNPELDFGGHNCLFHVKSFVILLFAIGNIAFWGNGPLPPGSTPVLFPH